MRRSIAGWGLLLVAGTSWAGWKSMGEEGASTTYLDTATIERKGDKAGAVVLVNLASPRRLVEVSYQSQKSHMEFRCDKPESRVLGTHLYSGAMGDGKVVYEDPSPKDWTPVQAGSALAAVQEAACR